MIVCCLLEPAQIPALAISAVGDSTSSLSPPISIHPAAPAGSGDALSEWLVLSSLPEGRTWSQRKGEKQDVTEDLPAILVSVVSVILSKFHVLLAFHYKI